MNKNRINNIKNKHQVTNLREHQDRKDRGIYLRDDYCDWGSSGMNEYTNEYPLHIISDDK